MPGDVEDPNIPTPKASNSKKRKTLAEIVEQITHKLITEQNKYANKNHN